MQLGRLLSAAAADSFGRGDTSGLPALPPPVYSAALNNLQASKANVGAFRYVLLYVLE
jgi:hypothetical protein